MQLRVFGGFDAVGQVRVARGQLEGLRKTVRASLEVVHREEFLTLPTDATRYLYFASPWVHGGRVASMLRRYLWSTLAFSPSRHGISDRSTPPAPWPSEVSPAGGELESPEATRNGTLWSRLPGGYPSIAPCFWGWEP